MIGKQQVKKYYQKMVEKNKIYTEKTITQEILNYLNKNRDFFVKNPMILDILDFPDKWNFRFINAFHCQLDCFRFLQIL